MGNRGKRYIKTKKKLSFKKIISFILLICFLILFIYSGKKIINYVLDNKKNQELMSDVSDLISVEKSPDDNEETYDIDFAKLKEKNSDTIGFIKVNGTDIEYVIVKAQDNDYYLRHNFEKQENVAGWIFADYRNKFDGTDKNIIIYGHNMRTGKMFATLKNVLDNKWQNEENNRYITFITENEVAKYEVFSVYEIEDEDYYITTEFSDGSFEQFVNKLKSRSLYDFGVDISEQDSIITLSTCGNNNNYRVVLHAKKIDN